MRCIKCLAKSENDLIITRAGSTLSNPPFVVLQTFFGIFLYVITRSEQRERRGNPEKSFYVRRTVDLWIATLITLQIV